MHAAIAHALMLVFAVAGLKMGWLMAHKPERASRFFTFGTEPIFGGNLVTSWCRIVGWVFTWGSGFGVVLYLVLIPVDLIRSR
jgi:hypothetical protein